jgi:hypothetical protein
MSLKAGGIKMTKIEMKIQEKYKRPVEEFVRRTLEKYGDKKAPFGCKSIVSHG